MLTFAVVMALALALAAVTPGLIVCAGLAAGVVLFWLHVLEHTLRIQRTRRKDWL